MSRSKILKFIWTLALLDTLRKDRQMSFLRLTGQLCFLRALFCLDHSAFLCGQKRNKAFFSLRSSQIFSFWSWIHNRTCLVWGCLHRYFQVRQKCRSSQTINQTFLIQTLAQHERRLRVQQKLTQKFAVPIFNPVIPNWKSQPVPPVERSYLQS